MSHGNGIAGNIAIIGAATTRFGELFEMDYSDLVIDAAHGALADAKLEPARIQAAWLGTYLPFGWGFEGNAGVSFCEPLNLWHIPVTRVANYCVTGMEAVRNAAFALACGEYDVVMAVGVEKMREVPSRSSLVAQHVEKGHPVFCKGRTAPGMFALLAQRYFKEYGAGEADLARVAVKNHFHGARNPKAHFRKEINEETALKAPKVAEPLGLFDCCPTTDGAAAVVLVRAEDAPKFTDNYTILRGMGLSVSGGYYTMQMDPEFSFCSIPATCHAAEVAYKQAGISEPAKQIDVAECHDCFTITELVNLEDLGLAKRGEGFRLTIAGETRIGGSMPVNPSGGLKSCGHPIGASGIRMISNVHDQLLGRAEKMQVSGAKTGLAHTLGGPGSVSCVTILGQP